MPDDFTSIAHAAYYLIDLSITDLAGIEEQLEETRVLSGFHLDIDFMTAILRQNLSTHFLGWRRFSIAGRIISPVRQMSQNLGYPVYYREVIERSRNPLVNWLSRR